MPRRRNSSPEEKNRLSHRGMALRALRRLLEGAIASPSAATMTPVTQPLIGAAGASLAFYVHMPWCVRKCPYCDFNSHQLSVGTARRGVYRRAAPRFRAGTAAGRETGGSTPCSSAAALRACSLPQHYARLLRRAAQPHRIRRGRRDHPGGQPGHHRAGPFRGLSGKPGSTGCPWARRTFSPAALKRLGRIHTADDTHRAVAELRAAGIHNFNLDLMYALPSQTFDEQAMYDVTTACALQAHTFVLLPADAGTRHGVSHPAAAAAR